MNWREAVEAAIRRYASKCDDGIFNRQDFLAKEESRIICDCGGSGETPPQTISRVLQELRDEGVIAFIDNRGTYQLIS